MTVSELLEKFDSTLKPFADEVGRGNYAYWIGSGVSKGRVPNNETLLLNAICHLQEKLKEPDSEPFEQALGAIIDLAKPSDVERASIDFAISPKAWPVIKSLLERLSSQYEKVLNVPVAGHDDDYILWHGVQITETYASPDLQPDSEHLAIALLALEGAGSTLISANWDGLIEKAIEELVGPGGDALRVLVQSEDFRDAARRVDLHKPHGCAVRAREDPATFRELLIARDPQINAWVAEARNAQMLQSLISIATAKKALVLGLSGQDANIKHVFSAAASRLNWPWPADAPACAFATPTLESDHRAILQIVYSTAYKDGNGAAVEESAVLGAFAKIVLVALVLHVLFAKLAILSEDFADRWDQTERVALRGGLIALRTIVSAASGADLLNFIEHVTRVNAHLFSLYRDGTINNLVQPRYSSISTVPTQQLLTDQFVHAIKMREFAFGIALLGCGAKLGMWTIRLPDTSSAQNGSVIIRSEDASSRLFIVRDVDAGLRLRMDGNVRDDDPDVVILYGGELPVAKRRTPTTTYGRTGKRAPRLVSLRDIINHRNGCGEALDTLRREGIL